MNPTWQQKKLKDYCQAKGIFITAYSPLGAKGTVWGTNDVMDNELLKEIANAHGKSFAQVSIITFFHMKKFNLYFVFYKLILFNLNLSEFLFPFWSKQTCLGTYKIIK